MSEEYKKPKLGICLVGISHLVHNNRWPVNRSYLDCFDNYCKEIITPLSKKFQTGVYLTTYKSSHSINIIEKYNPVAFQFFNLKNSHQILTFIKSIDLVEKEDLDYILFTRFDIWFNPDQVKRLKIDLNKFNFLCREKDYWESNHFVNDCFYVLPFSMLRTLKQACIDLYNNPPRPGLMDMHGLYDKLKDKVNINFMVDEHHLSSGNDIYTLKRL